MKTIAVIAAFVLVAWPMGAQFAPTRSPQPAPAKPSGVALPELNLRGSEPTMFAELVRQAGFSGGVATSNDDCSPMPERGVSIPPGTKLEGALTRLAKLGRGSSWQMEGRVANFFPGGLVPQLLRVHISSFTWDRATPFTEVLSRLRTLPEVAEAASRLGLSEAPFGGGSSPLCVRGDCSQKAPPEAAPAGIEMEQGAPLITVLNRVAQAHNGAVWNYSEFRCTNGRFFSLGALAE
jgi:hypothetical protein